MKNAQKIISELLNVLVKFVVKLYEEKLTRVEITFENVANFALSIETDEKAKKIHVFKTVKNDRVEIHNFNVKDFIFEYDDDFVISPAKATEIFYLIMSNLPKKSTVENARFQLVKCPVKATAKKSPSTDKK